MKASVRRCNRFNTQKYRTESALDQVGSDGGDLHICGYAAASQSLVTGVPTYAIREIPTDKLVNCEKSSSTGSMDTRRVRHRM